MNTPEKPPIPDLPDEAPGVAKPNPYRWGGQLTSGILGNGKRMGSWTGLPSPLAAPASGVLWGAGLGMAYHGIRNRLLPWINGEPADRRKKAINHALIGALAGLGTGALAEYNFHEKQQSAYNPNQDFGRLIAIILNEPGMSEFQKQQAIDRLNRLSAQQIRQLVASAAAGGLTGAALGTMLGVGPAVGGLMGALGGHLLGRNNFTF